MRPSKRDIVIATRRSRLATVQSESVGKAINRLNPRVGMRLVPLDTEADRAADHPLAAIGGKGLFTRAIEHAVLRSAADIAVHSLKDLPTHPTPGLIIAAIPRRYPAHDVLISPHASRIEDLPHGATVGTCSPRRGAQLLRLRADLNIVPLRGNIDTRLRKVLDERQVDATLLAAAGLSRLGLNEHLQKPVPVDQVLPAAAQGALAVQCRADDHVTMRRCMPLNDAPTSIAVNAERQVVRLLGADCHSPVAVLAETGEKDSLTIHARVLSPCGSQCLETRQSGTVKKLRALCEAVAGTLLDQGAKDVLNGAAAANFSKA